MIELLLDDRETAMLQAQCVGFKEVPFPMYDEGLYGQCKRFCTEYAQVVPRASKTHSRGELLNMAMGFLSRFPFGLHHNEKLAESKLNNWVNDLEVFPMWAIKETFEQFKAEEKEPVIAMFVKHVKRKVPAEKTAQYKTCLEYINKYKEK